MKKIKIALGVCLTLGLATSNAELIQQFKNPTFSGQGWASHVLTVEQMRSGAKNSVESKAAAEKAAAEAATQNTPLSKFMSLFTGQVYSQLATQLTNNLFKECLGASCTNGDFMVTETQKIIWTKLGNNVTLNVFDGKIVNNVFVPNAAPTQSITVPVSSFSF
jgi:curli production assembly/transport component CsgF